jgi:rhodanese-related sulfurtransferase
MKIIAVRTLFVFVALFSSQAFAEQKVPLSDINWEDVVIIDVRSRAEWNESRLEGSIWIPWNQIEQGAKSNNLNASQTLAFYCEAGVRANRAIRRLNRLGFSQTINLINLATASEVTGRLIEE